MSAAGSPFELLATRLRARVAEGRYRQAQAALEEYCGMLRESLAGLSPADPQRRLLAAEWEELAEQTRRRVLAGKAHAAARLARLHRPAGLYHNQPPAHHRWNLFV